MNQQLQSPPRNDSCRADPVTEGSPDSQAAAYSINSYEEARRIQISQNEARFRELGILQLVRELEEGCVSSKPQPKPRKPRAKKDPNASPKAPSRRSGRVAAMGRKPQKKTRRTKVGCRYLLFQTAVLG